MLGSYCAQFRFDADLGYFLPQKQEQSVLLYYFQGNPSIKDAIEAQGVPHTEVDVILIGDRSVDFSYQLQPADRVAVFASHVGVTVRPLKRLHRRPREMRFVVDVHLGKLARQLRMLGFDTLYDNGYTDPEIVAISVQDERIVLTRDRGILKTRAVQYGYCLRSLSPRTQVREVLARYGLDAQVRPFRRCMACNGLIDPVEKAEIVHRLEPKTRLYYDKFFICRICDRIYWRGSHHETLTKIVQEICSEAGS